MKLWVDDLRDPPDASWTVAKTSDEAIVWLVQQRWDVMSLDHDLGGDDTTRKVVIWLCSHPDEWWPSDVRVHTANPVGREYLVGMVERYKPAIATPPA